MQDIYLERPAICFNCQTNNYATATLCAQCAQPLAQPLNQTLAHYGRRAPRTFTQKVALFFAVMDGLLTPFALLGLVFGFAFLGNGRRGEEMLAGLGMLFSVAIGLWLFYGFIRHVKGKALRGGETLLWSVTAVYNLVVVGVIGQIGHAKSLGEWLFVALFAAYPALVVMLSAMCLKHNRQQQLLWQDNQIP